MLIIKICAILLICLCIDIDIICIIANHTPIIEKLIVLFFATGSGILIYTYFFR